jgi:hypothetical protein
MFLYCCIDFCYLKMRVCVFRYIYKRNGRQADSVALSKRDKLWVPHSSVFFIFYFFFNTPLVISLVQKRMKEFDCLCVYVYRLF